MPYIASMGIYVVSKNVMLDLLRDKFPGANDFGSEVIPGATSMGLRVSFHFIHSISIVSAFLSITRFFFFMSTLGEKEWNNCSELVPSSCGVEIPSSIKLFKQN